MLRHREVVTASAQRAGLGWSCVAGRGPCGKQQDSGITRWAQGSAHNSSLRLRYQGSMPVMLTVHSTGFSLSIALLAAMWLARYDRDLLRYADGWVGQQETK